MSAWMKRAQVFFACAAFLLAFIFQFRTFLWSGFPPSWNSMLATGASLDYLHLIPIQIRTLNPSFYARDYMVFHVTPLYPRFWRELTAFFSLRLSSNPILGNWIISCFTFFLAALGMGLLSYEISENILSAGIAVLFLLAGGTDPAGQYFLAMGNFAVPHEQALSLFPWVLYFLVKRIKNTNMPPWEMALLALAANIHAPTAIDMGLSLVSVYGFVSAARPPKNKASFLLIFLSLAAMIAGALPTLLVLRTWAPPSANFFAWAFPPLYPIEGWRAFHHFRGVIIFFFLLRWPAIVFAFWAIARPWRVFNEAKKRILLSASLPLSFLILGRLFVLIFPFSPSLIMAEFRAFMPAILPLIPLSSEFWRPMETQKGNVLILILGIFLLIHSFPHSGWKMPQDPSHIQEYETDLSRQIQSLTPRNALILAPDALVGLRAKSSRAVFGDSRALEMLLSFDDKIEKFYWPLYEKLNASYREQNWPEILNIAIILKAGYAALPANWNPCSQKNSHCEEIYRNREVALVELKGL